MVTAFQGYREWHIARKFSLTSTQSHAYIKALLRHGLDLKYDFICRVLEYMCVDYDYNKRLRKSCMAQATWRDVPRLALEPFHQESISVQAGEERVEVGEERVEVVTPVDADRDE